MQAGLADALQGVRWASAGIVADPPRVSRDPSVLRLGGACGSVFFVQCVRLVAYSDYLCPWCFNVAVRLQRLAQEDTEVQVSWRSYLLPSRPGRRDLERFRAYTQSWSRPGEEADSGRFQRWQGNTAPPHSSMPPQLAAKAAARQGSAAFAALHERLFYAYFAESRDISDRDTLLDLWRESGIPEKGFSAMDDAELRQQVAAEHQEALDLGATGVPSLRLSDSDVVVTGALPLASYQRWVARTRDRLEGGA